MIRRKWNRQTRRHLRNLKNDPMPLKLKEQQPYKVTRVRERKRKSKHESYTLTPAHKRWIFESNPRNNGGK